MSDRYFVVIHIIYAVSLLIVLWTTLGCSLATIFSTILTLRPTTGLYIFCQFQGSGKWNWSLVLCLVRRWSWMLLMNGHPAGCRISYRLRRWMTHSTIMGLLVPLRCWHCSVLWRKLSTWNDRSTRISRWSCSRPTRLKNLQITSRSLLLVSYILIKSIKISVALIESSHLNSYRLRRLVWILLRLLGISHQIVTNLRGIWWMNFRTLNPHFYACDKKIHYDIVWSIF